MIEVFPLKYSARNPKMIEKLFLLRERSFFRRSKVKLKKCEKISDAKWRFFLIRLFGRVPFSRPPRWWGQRRNQLQHQGQLRQRRACHRAYLRELRRQTGTAW